MTQYVITCDGETASPLFQSLGQAEDFRYLMLSYFKTYLPGRFQVELDDYMQVEMHRECSQTQDELAEANGIIERLEEEAQVWAAENREIRQQLADICAAVRRIVDNV